MIEDIFNKLNSKSLMEKWIEDSSMIDKDDAIILKWALVEGHISKTFPSSDTMTLSIPGGSALVSVDMGSIMETYLSDVLLPQAEVAWKESRKGREIFEKLLDQQRAIE